MNLPPPPKSKPPALKVALDKTGLRVPANLAPTWMRRREVYALTSILCGVRMRLREAANSKDLLYSRVWFKSAIGHLEQASADIAVARPEYVCPVCGGNPAVIKSCNLCKGIGLLSEFHWTAVSDELKAMRKIAVENQQHE